MFGLEVWLRTRRGPASGWGRGPGLDGGAPPPTRWPPAVPGVRSGQPGDQDRPRLTILQGHSCL